MGFFDKLKEVTGAVSKVTNAARDIANFAENPKEEISRTADNAARQAAGFAVNTAVSKAENAIRQNSNGGSVQQNVSFAPSRTVTEEDCGDDTDYIMTFSLSEDFVRFESHSGEVPVSYIYAPGKTEENVEYSKDAPCFGIFLDDPVFTAVESYKRSGVIQNAFEVTPREGKFLFSAKIPYYDGVMYMYGFDRCGGFWENNGIGVQYKRQIIGTPLEAALIAAVDEAVLSYNEEVKKTAE